MKCLDFVLILINSSLKLANKKKEAHDLKLDLCNMTSEIKNLRNEIMMRDKQVCMLKDKLNESNMDVSISIKTLFE